MRNLPRISIPVVITALSLSTAGMAASDDFASLSAHGNFDIGRNRHNMTFTFDAQESLAEESVSGNHIPLTARGVSNLINSCWVSERQHSGICNCSSMIPDKPLDVLNGDATLSFRMKRYGKLRHLGDGRFTFEPTKSFTHAGRDVFHVEITDGRGGYAGTNVSMHDSRHVPPPAVHEFRYSGNLPEFPVSTGKHQKHCTPMAIDLGGKRPDLLVQADSRLWFFANESKKGKLLFAEPIIVRATDGSEVKTDGAAVLEGDKLLVRRPDGTLSTATLQLKDTPQLQMGNPITDSNGTIFKCPARHFVLADWNRDHTPDLVWGLSGGLYVYPGRSNTPGGLAFTPENRPAHKRSYNIAPGVGDLNNDGSQDLLYGINRGTLHVWINCEKNPVITENECLELELRHPPTDMFMSNLNGAHTTVADFDGDGTPDIILDGNNGRELCAALGVSTDSHDGYLALIEKELYRLIGAILRYLQGYKPNINEVVFCPDVLSAGQNRSALLHPWAESKCDKSDTLPLLA